jgi:hypothetical protein
MNESQLRIQLLRLVSEPTQEAQVNALGEALMGFGLTPRPTLKERWAGHWTKGNIVVIASKIPNYTGWYASFRLVVNNTHAAESCDLGAFCDELNKHL